MCTAGQWTVCTMRRQYGELSNIVTMEHVNFDMLFEMHALYALRLRSDEKKDQSILQWIAVHVWWSTIKQYELCQLHMYTTGISSGLSAISLDYCLLTYLIRQLEIMQKHAVWWTGVDKNCTIKSDRSAMSHVSSIISLWSAVYTDISYRYDIIDILYLYDISMIYRYDISYWYIILRYIDISLIYHIDMIYQWHIDMIYRIDILWYIISMYHWYII